MSKDRILIPNSGGIYMEKVKDFQAFKNYNRFYPMPDNYTLNVFLINELRKNPHYNTRSFYSFLRGGGVIPPVIPIIQGSTGTDTIPNPRGGKVLKVAHFDELKTLWNKYHHRITFTDFELNEFISKLLRKIPNLNLEKYLDARSLMWKNFKLRFPHAKRRDFNNQFTNGDSIMYYKDTPIKVFGGDVNVNKLNDQVKESLGITDNFPISLQLTLEKYPIPGTDYNHQPSRILNEFEIVVSNNQSFLAKFRNIFKAHTIYFHSAAQCYRWKHSSNPSYRTQFFSNIFQTVTQTVC